MLMYAQYCPMRCDRDERRGRGEREEGGQVVSGEVLNVTLLINSLLQGEGLLSILTLQLCPRKLA